MQYGKNVIKNILLEVNMETIQITDFLEKNSAVKTQLQDSIEWIPNVVVDLHSDIDEIDLIFDDMINDMKYIKRSTFTLKLK